MSDYVTERLRAQFPGGLAAVPAALQNATRASFAEQFGPILSREGFEAYWRRWAAKWNLGPRDVGGSSGGGGGQGPKMCSCPVVPGPYDPRY